MIVLSAFEPFGVDALNSSYEVLREVVATMDERFVTLVTLPVSFERCAKTLFDAIFSHHPSHVVCFGQAAGRGAITVERTARNVVAAQLDNDGVTPTSTVVRDGAAATLESTLPVDELIEVARASGATAQESHSAGEYVCNALFFTLQHQLASTNVRSGFVHLPIIEEQRALHGDVDFLSREVQVRAVRAMVELLLAT